MASIYELHKRIMKHDLNAIDEIESLVQAKDIIKMIVKSNDNIYDGQDVPFSVRLKKRQIIALRDCSFCMVEEFNGKIECTKNRYGNRTIETCEDYDFEDVKLSSISIYDSSFDIQKKYYGKNIYLLLDE